MLVHFDRHILIMQNLRIISGNVKLHMNNTDIKTYTFYFACTLNVMG
jgi:hypothetical protein